MFVFPGMIARAAELAGMKVPEDPDGEFDGELYPHFLVFCNVQLGYRMPNLSVHWDNAKVIAAIPEDKIRNITIEELLDMGFQG